MQLLDKNKISKGNEEYMVKKEAMISFSKDKYKLAKK